MSERLDYYPGYDVLAKRNSPSWNAQTRKVIDERLAIDPEEHRFFTDEEWPTVKSIASRVVPQQKRQAPIPVAAMVDEKLHLNAGDGYRQASLPPMREAWRLGLAALDAEARAAYGTRFHLLPAAEQDGLLCAMQEGRLASQAWGSMPPKVFFGQRIIADMVKSYYAHPTAWSEIGFGGPASPRGYVRMDFNRRDPWEAAEAKPGRADEALQENSRVVGR